MIECVIVDTVSLFFITSDQMRVFVVSKWIDSGI